MMNYFFYYLLLLGPLLSDCHVQGAQLRPKFVNKIAANKSSDRSESKIVGGENVKWGGAPYQVAIFEKDHHAFCGGALIGPRAVITAASCVYGEESYPHHFVVRYGTLDYRTGPEIFAARVNRHPAYDPSTKQNDIAILLLKEQFAPGDNAAVITLATEAPSTGTLLRLTGWGQLSGVTKKRMPHLSTSLQEANNLVVVSGEDCASKWASSVEAGQTATIDPEKVVCAEGGEQSACLGDTGGAVMNGESGDLVGVISFAADKCSSSSIPNVYTSVAAYGDWIKANSGAYFGPSSGAYSLGGLMMILSTWILLFRIL